MTTTPAAPPPAPVVPPPPPVPVAPPARRVELSIDGNPVRVREGSTILDACREVGVETPTLCYLENLTPVNVCRVCVVEVEGSR
ncbi:MAG: (2Fe-2S)-binding protein, partial [Acidimicrobiales bacterium]|nr:(2Fe-2S)-binding protein [Acidimicrobiales bacterium]